MESLDVICPICLHRFDNPYIALDGFSYCRSCITQWLTQRPISPMTGKMMYKNIYPNSSLQDLLDGREVECAISKEEFTSMPYYSVSMSVTTSLESYISYVETKKKGANIDLYYHHDCEQKCRKKPDMLIPNITLSQVLGLKIDGELSVVEFDHTRIPLAPPPMRIRDDLLISLLKKKDWPSIKVRLAELSLPVIPIGIWNGSCALLNLDLSGETYSEIETKCGLYYNCDFSKCTFYDCNFDRTQFNYCDLKQSIFVGKTRMIGEEVSFYRTNMQDVRFGSNMRMERGCTWHEIGTLDEIKEELRFRGGLNVDGVKMI
jgi:hypothetical protein